MALVYYRVYATQESLTLLFDIEHKSTICRAIAQIRPVLQAVLPVPERALATAVRLAQKEADRQRKRIGNVADFVREYPELSILIDGTEQRSVVCRPNSARRTSRSARTTTRAARSVTRSSRSSRPRRAGSSRKSLPRSTRAQPSAVGRTTCEPSESTSPRGARARRCGRRSRAFG